MNLQPSEFIATYNTVPGTVVRLSLSHEQFAARMRGDTANLPVTPLDTDTDTDTSTDKENSDAGLSFDAGGGCA